MMLVVSIGHAGQQVLMQGKQIGQCKALIYLIMQTNQSMICRLVFLDVWMVCIITKLDKSHQTSLLRKNTKTVQLLEGRADLSEGCDLCDLQHGSNRETKKELTRTRPKYNNK